MNVIISQTTREKVTLQLRNHDKMYPLIHNYNTKQYNEKLSWKITESVILILMS